MATSEEKMIRSALGGITPTQWNHLWDLTSVVGALETGEWLDKSEASQTADDNSVTAMPFHERSRAVRELVAALYHYEFVVPIAWTEWWTQHRNRLNDMDPATTSSTELVKYIVAVLRSDRFIEGNLEAEIRSGRFLVRLRAVIAEYRSVAK